VFARGDYADVTGSLEDLLRSLVQRLGQDPDARDGQPHEYAFIGCSGD
jgi:hypothetical protein